MNENEEPKSEPHQHSQELANSTNDPAGRFQFPKEHDLVRLRFDLPEHGLEGGATGTVVHVYRGDDIYSESGAFEVEFQGPAGTKVVTLYPRDIEPQTINLNLGLPQPPPPVPVQPTVAQPDPPPLPPVTTAAPPKKPRKKKETKADRLFNAAQAVLDAVEQANEKVGDLNAALEEARSELETAIQEVRDKLEELKSVREDEYQSWYDNLPEGLQQSPVGEKLSTLLEIDLEPDMPEVPEIEELDFSSAESAAQEILDADLPLGFGRD